MKILDYAVKNYQFTLLMTLMVIALGATTILTMPRSEDPEIKQPIFPVIVVYPGTSPKDMEELVVKPLESKIYALENIKQIKTTINNGLAVLMVEYKYSHKVDDDYHELVSVIGSARASLPQDILSIDIKRFEPSSVNILQIALISENASRPILKETAERLKDELEKVPTLKDVTINGLPQQLVRVDVDPGKLSRLHLPLAPVIEAIKSESVNIPGGSVNGDSKAFSVIAGGNFQSIDDIKNTIVNSVNGRNILLSDVAEIYPAYAPDTYITRLNGHRCLFVDAAQKESGNISSTQKAYLPIIASFKQTLPSNIDMVMHFEQADNVNKRLSGLGIDFLIAVMLVLITLLPLGLRASIIVMISIPLSLAIGIVLINAFGFGLNQLSIVGFVVALGLLVDDSIVVVENIDRWIREGHTRIEAALKATRQISLAVAGCTATLVIAFMPLMFLPEATGDFIRSLPIAVISSVLGSMIVALTVIPFLSSRILSDKHEGEGKILIFFQKVIHNTYAKLLERALKNTRVALVIAFLIFAGAIALIPVIGFSLFPPSEKPQFLIDISSPLQSNIHYSDTITRQIEKQLAQFPEVEFYASNVGKGNPFIYYNILQQGEQSDFAEIFVQLHKDISADKKNELITLLRKKWTPYPGAKVEVKNFEQGVPMLSPVEVRLTGDNLDTLQRLAGRVETMLKETEGTLYVNNPVRINKTDLKIKVNKEKALSLGVPSIAISKTVRMAVTGIDVGTYNDPAEERGDYTVQLGVHGASDPGLSVFEGLYVNNVRGDAVPLSQVAALQFESSPARINHYNKIRTVSVNSFVDYGYLNDRVIQAVSDKMARMKLPPGYYYKMGGELETREQSFGGFGSVIVITLFMFIAVLVLEFKTFKSTLIVLSVIPLGIVGAVIALLVTGNSLSFIATIGIIALAGIEIKNTILLVDFTNQLRREGTELNEAIEKAGEIRFLPIILTTLTAIGGLLPIAFSGNPLVSPLAIVMIGGLVSSTLLSRIVTPVVYKLIPPAI